MTTLSARDNYHKTHTEIERADVSNLVNSTPVKTLMVYAMAQLAEARLPEPHAAAMLRGAELFRDGLLTLASPIVAEAEWKPAQLDPVPGTPDGR